MELVQDPDLLNQLNAPDEEHGAVQDPELLAILNSEEVSSTQGKPAADQVGSTAPNAQKLIKKLEDWNFLATASNAMTTKGAPEKALNRRTDDGLWDAPAITKGDRFGDSLPGKLLSAVDEAGTSFFQRFGTRSAQSSQDADVQEMLRQFQTENNLTDEQVQTAWSDFGNLARDWTPDETPVRVLSDGSLVPNLANSAFLDPVKAEKLINESSASPAEKVKLISSLGEVAQNVTDAKMQAYQDFSVLADFQSDAIPLMPALKETGIIDRFESPEAWALRTGRNDDYGSPEFMLAYEKDVIGEDAGTMQKAIWGAVGSTLKGNLKLASTFTGVAGMVESSWTGSKEPGAIGAYSGDIASVSNTVSAAAPDIGLVGSLLEEAPSLALQIATARVLGAGAGALTKSQAAVQTAASFGAVAMSGLQSGGMTFANEIAEGADAQEARTKALQSGISTAIITGMFQKAGLGGVEKIAAGKAAGEITIRDVIASVGMKELRQRATVFAKNVLGATMGEGFEEFTDEFVGAFLNADPDEMVADAWTNAEKAFKIGAFIGGVVDVGFKAIEGKPALPPTESAPAPDPASQSFVNETTASLKGAGLNQTARALTVTTPTQTPLAPAPEQSDVQSAELPSTGLESVKIGDQDIELPLLQKSADPGVDPVSAPKESQRLAEAVFGKPAAGREFMPEVKSADFGMVDLPGTSGVKAVTFRGSFTNRTYNPSTKTFGDMDPAAANVLSRRQGGTLYNRSLLEIASPKQSSEKASAPAATVSSPNTLTAKGQNDEIDVTPSTMSGPSTDASVESDANPTPRNEAPPAKTTPPSDQATDQAPVSGQLEVEGSSVRFNPATGNVEVGSDANPEVRANGIRQAERDRSAFNAEGDGAAIVNELPEWDASVDSLQEEFPDATPDQIGKLLVARARGGDVAAMESLESIQSDSVRGEVDKISSVVTGGQPLPVRKAAPIAVAPAAQTGRFTVPEEGSPILTERGNTFMDSGRSTTNPTIDRTLSPGAVVTTTENGNEVMYVVSSTSTLPGGGVRHNLGRVTTLDPALVAESAKYLRGKKVTSNKVAALAGRIQESLRSATMDTAMPALLKSMETLIRAQTQAIGGASAVGKLNFGMRLPGVTAFQEGFGENSKIHFNEEYMLERLVALTQSIDPENEIAMGHASQDFAEWVSQTIFHEITHDVAERAVDQKKLASAVKDTIKAAGKNPSVMAAFLRDARFFLRAGFAPGAGSLAGIPDAQVIDLLSGREIDTPSGRFQLSGRDLEAAHLQVGHEMLARLLENIRTGRSYEEVGAIVNNWITQGSGTTKTSSTRTLARRLADLASRFLAAVDTFLQTHRLMGDLPPAWSEMAHDINNLMKSEGISAPDVFSVQESAVDSALDTLRAGFTPEATPGTEAAEKQRNARMMISKLTARLNASGITNPIRVNPLNGSLEINPLVPAQVRTELQPALTDLESTFSPDALLRAQRMASDLRSVLRFANNDRAVRRTSKILQSFSPEGLVNEAPSIIRNAADDISKITGMSLGDFFTRLRSGYAPDFVPEPETESVEAFFTTGLGDRNLTVRGALNELNAAREEFSALTPPISNENPSDLDTWLSAQKRMRDSELAYNEAVQSAAVGDSQVAMALRELNQRNDMLRQTYITRLRQANRRLRITRISTIGDLFAAYRRDGNALLNQVENIGIPSAGLSASLDRHTSLMESISRLERYDAEMAALISGRDAEAESFKPVWQRVTLPDGSPTSFSIPSGGQIAAMMSPEAGAVLEGVRDSTSPGITLEDDFGSPVEITSNSIQTEHKLMDRFLDGEITYEENDGSSLNLMEEVYRPVANRVASELSVGARNVLGILGVSHATKGSDLTAVERTRMKSNAHAFNARVVSGYIDRFWTGGDLSSTDYRTGGFAYDLNDGGNIIFRDQALDLPTIPDSPGSFEESMEIQMSSGFTSGTLAGVASFLSQTENAHPESPAAFARRLVAPGFIEMLALTKGLPVQDRLTSLDPSGALAAAYDRLAPELQNATVFSATRAEVASRGMPALAKRFWQVHRVAGMTNGLYRSSIRRLNNRKIRSEAEQRLTEGAPFDTETINRIDFQMGLLRRIPMDRGKGGTLVSLVSPISARAIMAELESVNQEIQQYVRFTSDENAAEAGLDVTIGLRGEGRDADDSEVTSRFDSRREWLNDKNIEALRKRRAQVVSAAMMAVMGGNRAAVLRLVNHPDFREIQETEDGSRLVWNEDRLMSFLQERLDALHADEADAGHIFDESGSAFDGAVQGLADRNAAQRPVLERILATGATISQMGAPTTLLEGGAAYEATASSILSGLASKIPGLAHINGKMPWTTSKDGDVPTVMFVPDENTPALVYPYRGGVTPTDADTSRAIESMLVWMQEKGKVDVVASGREILAQISAVSADPFSSNLRAAIMRNGEDRLLDGRSLDEVDDARMSEYARLWSETLQRGLDRALGEIGQSAGILLDRRSLDPNMPMSPKLAASLVTLVLTQPKAKQVLTLSAINENGFSEPAAHEVALFGNLIGSDAVDYAVTQYMEESIANLPRNQKVVDELGVEISPDNEESYDAAVRSEISALFDTAMGKLGLRDPGSDFSERIFSPLPHLQSERASNFLYGLLRGFQPEFQGKPLTPGAPRRMTRMEALQLLSTVQVPNDNLQNSTVDDLVALSDQEADRLRADYAAFALTDGSMMGMSRLHNYGAYSFRGAMVREDANFDVWRDTRIVKGEIATAIRLGAMFSPKESRSGNTFDNGILEATPERLKQMAANEGMTLLIPDGDAKIDAFDLARREYEEELAEERAWAADVQRELVTRQYDLDDARAALAAIEANEGLILSATGTRGLQQRIAAAIRPVVSGPVLDPSIKAFFDNHDSLLDSMAEKIVEDAISSQGQIFGSVSLNEAAQGELSTDMLDLRQAVAAANPDLEQASSLYLEAMNRADEAELANFASSKGARIRNSAEKWRHTYNGEVNELARQVERIIPGLIRSSDHQIERGMNQDQAQARIRSFSELMGRLRDPSEVMELSADAAIENAIREAMVYDPSAGLGSPDYLGLTGYASSDRRIYLSEEAASSIRDSFHRNPNREALLRDIRSIITRDIAAPSDVARNVVSRVKSSLQSRIDSLNASNPAVTSRAIIDLASQLALTQGVDSITAARVAQDTYREVAAGKVDTAGANLEQMIVSKFEAEQRNLAFRTSAAAQRPMGYTVLNYIGNPDDIAITRRALAKYGTIWNEAYMNNVGASQYLDGFLDASSAAMSADETFAKLVQDFSNDTGGEWVSDNGWVTPADLNTRIARHLKGKPGVTEEQLRIDVKKASAPLPAVDAQGKANVRARTDRLMKFAEGMGMFKLGSGHALDAVFGRFSPNAMVKESNFRMFSAMAQVVEAGELKGKGREVLPDGQGLGRDLHSRMAEALNLFEVNPSPVTLQAVDQAYTAMSAYRLSNHTIDGLVLGFIPASAFKSKLGNLMMTHGARVRYLWARHIKGIKAAEDIFSLIQFGADGQTGRNAYIALRSKMGEHMVALTKKVKTGTLSRFTGGTKLEILSEGYMLSVVKSIIDQQSTRKDDKALASQVIEMFNQADAGIIEALRAGMSTSAVAPWSLDDLKSWPKRKLNEFRAYFGEQTYQLLEMRKLQMSLRDRWVPILQQVESGMKDIGTAKVEIELGADKQARGYAKDLNELFSYVKEAYIDQMVRRGKDRSFYDNLPVVPPRWQKFNTSLAEDREVPDFAEMVDPANAAWTTRTSPGSFGVGAEGKGLRMLQIHGMHGPLSIINDLIYRITVAPSYDVFSATAGVTESGDQGGAGTHALRAKDGKEGALVALTQEKKMADEEAKTAALSARKVAYMGQQIITKDISGASPNYRLARMTSDLALAGAAKALLSFSNLWRQFAPPVMAYVTARGGFKRGADGKRTKSLENAAYGKVLLDYFRGMAAHKLNKALPKALRSAPSKKTFYEKVNDLANRWAPSIHVRGADGNHYVYDEASRMKLSFGQRAEGRLAGRMSPALELLTSPVKAAHNAATYVASKGMDFTIAKPEKVAARTIFAFALHKLYNQSRVERGLSPIEIGTMLDDMDSTVFPSWMLAAAETETKDMLPETDTALKGDIFQQSDSVMLELLRGAFITFANHPITMAGNNLAAARMIRRSEDAETSRTGRRVMSANVMQNVAFMAMRFEMLALGVAAALAGGDEEKRKRIYLDIYGIDPKDKDGGNAMKKWATTLLGGSTDPLGYDRRRGGFSDREWDKDIASYSLPLYREAVNSIPVVGLFTGTTAGSAGLDYALMEFGDAVIPGDFGEYTRAGFVAPEWMGGTGKGPKGNSLEKGLYDMTKFFMNDVSDRSSAMMGLNMLIEPAVVLSNAKNDDMGDAAALYGLQAPMWPRELRRVLTKQITEDIGARVWDGSWKAR